MRISDWSSDVCSSDLWIEACGRPVRCAFSKASPMTTLYKVDSGKLVHVKRSSLANEAMLQGWVAQDPSIVGLDVLASAARSPSRTAGGDRKSTRLNSSP